jgi:hypothetical protein
MYMLVVRDLFGGPEYKTIGAEEADEFSPEKVSTNPRDPWYGYILLDGVARTSIDNDRTLCQLRQGLPPHPDHNLPATTPKNGTCQ